MESRGLDGELAVALGLESAVVPGGGEWIAIPFKKNGIIVNNKYRRVDGKDFRQDKGATQCWWNYDVITDPSLAGAPLIVTEGEFDAMAAIQAGFPRTISVPGGAPSQSIEGGTDGKYGFIADSMSDLRDVRDIVLAVDGDGPGRVLLSDLVTRFGRARCRFVTYPEGCKDLNDVLREHGTRAVAETIGCAQWMRVKGLYRMSALPPEPDAVPFSPGIPELEPHYNLRRGDFCVITGIPGMGKSTFANDLACRMAERHGWNTCFASFEQNPQIDHRRALRTWHGQMPAERLSPASLLKADMWIDSKFVFIVPDEEEDATLDWLLETLAAAVLRYDVQMAIIDPWNELDHVRPRDQSLTEYVGDSIRKFKKFARRWHIHLIVVAHPTKLARTVEGKLPIPTLYDISDSAHWFNKPDIGVVVHRDDDGVKVRIAKSRYHHSIGKPGTALMRYDESTCRFYGLGY